MSWGQDVHYAFRALASRRLYAPASIAVLAITVFGLGGAALLATWLPARRAARIDPLDALRSE